MYSKTKQDIKNLRYSLVVTHVRSNHANFQRFWPIDKGAESFEIRPPTVHSNFSVESKNQLHNKICQSQKNMTPQSFGFEYLSIIYVSYAYSQKWEVLLCISMLLINKNKLNSDSKIFPGKMTGVKPHLLFHGHW